MAEKKSGGGWKWILAVVALALIAGGFFYSRHSRKENITYNTEPVVRDDLTQVVTATGTLNPVVNVTVGSQVSGRISKLYVDYNSVVKSNQVIAEIDPATYQAAVEQATADLANAKADLKITRVAWHEVEDATLWQTTTGNRASVHVGFLGIWNALREFVVTALIEEVHARAGTDREDFRVVVTGHSMGGAVGVLCGYVVQKTLRSLHHPHPEPIVYTFGQPRIGKCVQEKGAC